MAQLIKLQDYISRYEIDIFHYPGQFIRLKQENWKKFNSMGELQEAYISEEEKKQYYLDALMPFQLKWASSTIREKSFLDYYYKSNPTLRYFLQRFPDTFLVMFQPIFLLKKAPVEGEIIIITPVEILCLTIIEFPEEVTIIAGDDRTWMQEKDNVRTPFLSPMISLKRTDVIIRSILNRYSINFPVRKLVLSQTNEIQYQTEPYQTKYIGKEAYPEWFKKIRTFKSPLKHMQLKASEALLMHCQTTSVKRSEWEEDDLDLSMDDDQN
ncbi:NERD domain-containing protein [Bacillaceae bacterium S4-13-58]